MAGDGKREFDWIDDAFDDKRTAEEIEKAKVPALAVVLLAIALIVSALFILLVFIAIP